MIENAIPIKNGIMINIDVSVKIWKNIMCAKNIIFEILLVITQQVLLMIQWLNVIKL